MRQVIEPHQLPPRLFDTPLGQRGVAGIEMRSGPRPWNVKEDLHGNHDEPGVGHGDHRLPGKPPGEALKRSTYPLGELHPAFGS
jgi:hypothetical protein